MTTDQYSELVDFLGGKFGRIDEQFAEAKRDREEIREEARRERERLFEEARRERERLFEESRRHAVVLFEQSQANLKTVAEGLGLRMVGVEGGLSALTGRAVSLEGRVESLDHRVESLDQSVRRGLADHEARIQAREKGA